MIRDKNIIQDNSNIYYNLRRLFRISTKLYLSTYLSSPYVKKKRKEKSNQYHTVHEFSREERSHFSIYKGSEI